jgi:hypothetical protein
VATASIEVSGPDVERQAVSLRAALGASAGVGERVSPVEVERSAELVVAVIGLVFAGVGAAKTLWEWWSEGRRSKGLKVRILFEDGTQVDLSGVDQQQLEAELEQRAKRSG